jgi:TatD DNase family protein
VSPSVTAEANPIDPADPLGLIDIGVNLTHKRFRPDLGDVIARARAAGVGAMVVTGTSVGGSWAAWELARAHPGVLFSTAGVHPHGARECGDRTVGELRDLAGRAEVRAVGECGLDYDRNFSPQPVQRQWFAAQLELAGELSMPVFLHERAAHADFLSIVRERRAPLPAGVVHCFTGSAAELDAYLDLDLHIGITGWICDERRGHHLRDLIPRIPLDRLMVETDAPFLTPRDLPRPPPDRRNEPSLLPHILDRVAAAAGRPREEVARATTATARRFFRLGEEAAAPGAMPADGR